MPSVHQSPILGMARHLRTVAEHDLEISYFFHLSHLEFEPEAVTASTLGLSHYATGTTEGRGTICSIYTSLY